MNTMPRPKRSDVEGIYLILDVEVVTNTGEMATDDLQRSRDLDTVRDMITRITKHTDQEPHGFYSDDIEDSEYDSELKVYAGKWGGMLTVDQWVNIANEYCLDLEDDEVLPEIIEPTMGSLTEEGLIPAVSIPHMDEGWGYGGYEPVIIISCYVSALMKEGYDNAEG